MRLYRLVGTTNNGEFITGQWRDMSKITIGKILEGVIKLNQGFKDWSIEYSEEHKETDGFYKVASRGFSISVDTFYNPDTDEEKSYITWDNDDWRVEEAMKDWRECPSVEMDFSSPIYIKWLHKHQIAVFGDKVIISRGRKYKGEIKQIKGEFTYVVEGTYGKADVEYWTFTDGTKVAKHNCDLYLED